MSNKPINRRKLLQSIAAGSGAVVAGKSIPETWSKPVIDSIVLPAHATTTDVTGSGAPAPTTTEGPLTYFGLDLDFLAYNQNGLDGHSLLATISEALVPEARADSTGIGGMSVVVSGTSANVRFLNARSDAIHAVVAPLDGSKSGGPTFETGCATVKQGPESVQLINYSKGASKVQVRVNGGEGSWDVEVPMAPLGTLALTGCIPSDRRLKTDIEPVAISHQGHKLYSFKYRDDTHEQSYVGVMAQDILATRPEAVIRQSSGFYSVRYDLLGLNMVSLDEWQREGARTVERKH